MTEESLTVTGVQAADFRTVLGHFPTGVVVITALAAAPDAVGPLVFYRGAFGQFRLPEPEPGPPAP